MLPPPELPFSPNEFKDRKAWLVTFGVLTMLMGGLCALLSLFLVFISIRPPAAPNGGVPPNAQAMIPGMVMYAVMAVALVWLGIGSMMERRWARALLLIFSWSWLVTGVISVGMMVFMLPHLMESMNAATPAGQPEMPASAKSVAVLAMLVMMSVIFLVLPTVWVLFYQSRHVKATCEAHDPVVRWTDRCPLPVLAVCIWLTITAPLMLLMAVVYKGVVPVFGTFVVGPLGAALYVVIGLLWAYSARAFYRLDRRGWWIVFASVALFSISAFVTYSRHDVSELYSLMGYPEEQIAQIQKLGMFKGQAMAWMTLASMTPFLGYLLYVRRYFAVRIA